MGWVQEPHFEERIEAMIAKDVRKVTLKLTREVITRTPVRTGRLRGAWRIGVDRVPAGEPRTPTKSIMVATDAAQGQLSAVSMKTRSIWIVNNLPYAQRIEDGHGGRAPGVMVAASISLFKSKGIVS